MPLKIGIKKSSKAPAALHESLKPRAEGAGFDLVELNNKFASEPSLPDPENFIFRCHNGGRTKEPQLVSYVFLTAVHFKPQSGMVQKIMPPFRFQKFIVF